VKVTAETITDVQTLQVADVCGYAPGNRDFDCPKCGATAPSHCKGRVRKSHVARIRVAEQKRAEWRARCAQEFNTRYGDDFEPLTEQTVTDQVLDAIIENEHEWPTHISHAARVARIAASRDAVRIDLHIVATAWNAKHRK